MLSAMACSPALKDVGYEAGKNLSWQYQSAQGNTGTAAQIAW